jgi:hypothetical protein
MSRALIAQGLGTLSLGPAHLFLSLQLRRAPPRIMVPPPRAPACERRHWGVAKR